MNVRLRITLMVLLIAVIFPPLLGIYAWRWVVLSVLLLGAYVAGAAIGLKAEGEEKITDL